jgi:soluble lytic murein transglycosylase
VAAAPESSSGVLATAGALLAAGLDSDAMTLVDRWSAGDPRLGAVPDRGSPAALLDAARLAYAAGRIALGIRLSARAQEVAGDDAWAVAPWLHPPALDTLFAAPADSAGGPEPALLRAIAWQESKFDPGARSRSDALGLLQLKLATAREVAARLREPAPGPEDLLDPARNLRLGRAYFARQLDRFGGNVSLALAAYNAGPGAVARWRTVQRAAGGHVGGDALDVELIASPETEDYVKRILAVRQAYRELRPGVGRR